MKENKLSATVDDRMKRRRITGITICALAAVLALTWMLNRNQPINTFSDGIAWITLFFVLSFLIWLVPMALFARYMEVSGEYEEPAPRSGKAD